MEEFKVGDRVYDLGYGWGEVTSIDKCDTYPIQVVFAGGKIETYTKDGYLRTRDPIRLLYHQEMAIVPKDSLGRVIQVKLDGKWEPRGFIAELNGGDVLCYEAKTLEEANDHTIVLRHSEWREMPEKVKLTRAEIAEKLGIDIDQFEITD
jgi:hypothetical protein